MKKGITLFFLLFDLIFCYSFGWSNKIVSSLIVAFGSGLKVNEVLVQSTIVQAYSIRNIWRRFSF